MPYQMSPNGLIFPHLEYDGRGTYRLVEPYVHEGNDQTFVVPAGFKTDLATVPRIFWSLLPPQGAYEAAAVLHDYLCVQLAWCRDHNERHPDTTTPAIPPVNARDTDGLFRHVMKIWGVGPITRFVMWAGVRWGALANPARRAGWWRDAPAVLAITAGLLAATVLVAAGIHELVDLILGLF